MVCRQMFQQHSAVALIRLSTHRALFGWTLSVQKGIRTSSGSLPTGNRAATLRRGTEATNIDSLTKESLRVLSWCRKRLALRFFTMSPRSRPANLQASASDWLLQNVAPVASLVVTRIFEGNSELNRKYGHVGGVNASKTLNTIFCICAKLLQVGLVSYLSDMWDGRKLCSALALLLLLTSSQI